MALGKISNAFYWWTRCEAHCPPSEIADHEGRYLWIVSAWGFTAEACADLDLDNSMWKRAPAWPRIEIDSLWRVPVGA